jgi:hypothetical protein
MNWGKQICIVPLLNEEHKNLTISINVISVLIG